jgi:cell wall-associated NlpC family hydrolase
MKTSCIIIFACLFFGCASKGEDQSRVTEQAGLADKTTIGLRDGAAITRQEVLRSAEAYAREEWRATDHNVFHGTDQSGVRIDTPDAQWWGRGGWYSDGRVNVGLPYCWGGDSTLAEFEHGIVAGQPAGYDYKVDDPQHSTPPPMSSLPVGLDCSGFVSRCWRLKGKRSTRDLIKECRQLPSFDELLPGDAINKPNGHVVLFKEWLDQEHDKMRVIEAGDCQKNDPPEYYEKVHENDYKRTWLSTNGFMPLRYRGIIEP